MKIPIFLPFFHFLSLQSMDNVEPSKKNRTHAEFVYTSIMKDEPIIDTFLRLLDPKELKRLSLYDSHLNNGGCLHSTFVFHVAVQCNMLERSVPPIHLLNQKYRWKADDGKWEFPYDKKISDFTMGLVDSNKNLAEKKITTYYSLLATAMMSHERDLRMNALAQGNENKYDRLQYYFTNNKEFEKIHAHFVNLSKMHDDKKHNVLCDCKACKNNISVSHKKFIELVTLNKTVTYPLSKADVIYLHDFVKHFTTIALHAANRQDVAWDSWHTYEMYRYVLSRASDKKITF